MTSIFISHKREDSGVATNIAARLRTHGVSSYLDVLDPQLEQNGDDLGEYLRQKIGTCTHLLAVVSPATTLSWWVPFEIGIATEKVYPLASYVSQGAPIPEYLQKWPYLRSDRDVDVFALQIGRSSTNTNVRNLAEATFSDRFRYARDFHRSLRAELGQR